MSKELYNRARLAKFSLSVQMAIWCFFCGAMLPNATQRTLAFLSSINYQCQCGFLKLRSTAWSHWWRLRIHTGEP